jgi:hypothetical protein
MLSTDAVSIFAHQKQHINVLSSNVVHQCLVQQRGIVTTMYIEETMYTVRRNRSVREDYSMKSFIKSGDVWRGETSSNCKVERYFPRKAPQHDKGRVKIENRHTNTTFQGGVVFFSFFRVEKTLPIVSRITVNQSRIRRRNSTRKNLHSWECAFPPPPPPIPP